MSNPCVMGMGLATQLQAPLDTLTNTMHVVTGGGGLGGPTLSLSRFQGCRDCANRLAPLVVRSHRRRPGGRPGCHTRHEHQAAARSAVSHHPLPFRDPAGPVS